jgi:hypothetical protein
VQRRDPTRGEGEGEGEGGSGFGEEPVRWRLPAGTAASSNSSGATRLRTMGGDVVLKHGSEAGDGFGRQWSTVFGPALSASDTGAAGHAFMERAWRRPVLARPGDPVRCMARQVETVLRRAGPVQKAETDRWDPAADLILN